MAFYVYFTQWPGMLSSVSTSNGRNVIPLILEWIVTNTWASAYLHPCHVTWCVGLSFVSSIKHHLTHFIRCDFSRLGQICYSWQVETSNIRNVSVQAGFKWQGRTDINQRKCAVQHNILILCHMFRFAWTIIRTVSGTATCCDISSFWDRERLLR